MNENFFKENEIELFNNDGITDSDLKWIVDVIPYKVIEHFRNKRIQLDLDFYEALTLLKYIYVVRTVRDYGLLVSDCYDFLRDADKYILFFFECEFIESSKATRSFRNLEIIDLTELGEQIGSILIEKYIEKLNFNEIRNNFGDFLLNSINNYKISQVEAKFRYYPGPEIESSFTVISYDEKFNPLHEWSKVFYSKLYEFFSYMKEQHLCYKATNYAGTRGGESRQPFYLIPIEFMQILSSSKVDLHYGDYKIKMNHFEYETINLIAMHDFFKAYDEENYQFASYSRKVLDLIYSKIDELKNKEAISINQSYFKNNDLFSPPFKIIDANRYDNILKNLFNEIIEKANQQIFNLLNLKTISEPVPPTIKTKGLNLFISYATLDAEIFKIREIAESLSIYPNIEDVLFWQKDSRDNIFTFMNENVGKCDLMLLFCSPNATKSPPVEKEWTAFDYMNKPIIPVFHEVDDIPPLLKPRQGIKFNIFEFQKNIENLYDLIIKKITKD